MQSRIKMFIRMVTFFLFLTIPSFGFANDLHLEGTLSSGTYVSNSNIYLQNDCTINNNVDVVLEQTFSVVIGPGTAVKLGGSLTVKPLDNDGLSNACEMQYFGDLDENPNDDTDGDQLTNYEECALGLNPNFLDLDNDNDDLPDWWEIEHFGLDLSNDHNQDFDGDGLSNLEEYQYGLDPNTANADIESLMYTYNEKLELINATYSNETLIDYIYDEVGNLQSKSITLALSQQNNSPNTVSYIEPTNTSIGVSTSVDLRWNAASDPDAQDTVYYDVYMGTTPSVSLIISSIATTIYSVELDKNTTYYWQIVAKDNKNYQSTGPVWSFTTGSGPQIEADFVATPTSGIVPLIVYFTDLTVSEDSITSWKWDFNNDGIIDSTIQNPYHYYIPGGDTSYTVSLTTIDQNGHEDTIIKENYITSYKDDDGDGIADVIDNCPNLSNSGQEDEDNDGIGDDCDNCPSDPINDPDADNYCGSFDNCPWLFNPDQTDSDSNGVGDVCEGDYDSDGVDDGTDNCPYFSNPDQLDNDGDGFGDVCTKNYCVSSSSEFQAALTEAQWNSKNDVIMLQQGLYSVSENGGSVFSYGADEKYTLVVKGGHTFGCGDRTVDYENTIIEGGTNNVGVLIANNTVDYTEMLSGYDFKSFIIEGITVKNGGPNRFEIMAMSSSGDVEIKHCKATIDSSPTVGFGGLQLETNGPGDIIVENCTIIGNAVEEHKGIFASSEEGDVVLTRNYIANNRNNSNYRGGGVAASTGGNIIVSDNIIINNYSSRSGGGIFARVFLTDTSISMVNNIIADNYSGASGGGVYLGDDVDTLSLINNTIVNNSANNAYGGGIYIFDGEITHINLYNNIIWDNTALNGADVYYEASFQPDANAFFNNFNPAGFSGLLFFNASNNLNIEPNFLNTNNGDYHLNSSSPMKNSGSNSAPELPSMDIDGDLRIIDGIVEIGADEITN